MAHSKEYKGMERRRYLRLDRNSSFVFYLQKGSTQEIKESIINNISVNGFSFDTLEPINPGVNLECEIYQPLYCQKNIIVPISLLAKVIWTRKIEKENFVEGENKYRIEVEFSEIKKEDRQKIAKYVEERASEK